MSQNFKNFTPNENKNSEWLRLEQGDNKIRLVTGYEPIAKHYNPATKKSVVCVGKDSGCELNHKERFQVKFLCWTIDRKDGQMKLAELPYSVITQIAKLRTSEDYGFELLPDYDLTIKREGEGLETEYSVIPARKSTPLTETELEELKSKKDPTDIVNSMKEKQIEKEEKVENSTEDLYPNYEGEVKGF